jgi:hypothetical protein
LFFFFSLHQKEKKKKQKVNRNRNRRKSHNKNLFKIKKLKEERGDDEESRRATGQSLGSWCTSCGGEFIQGGK